MTEAGSITRWIGQLRTGDPAAAQVLWEHFYEQLIRIARHKLRDASRRVTDEEDVLVDVFDSFCRGAEAGRFPKLEDRDDLWQVLVMLTARKSVNQWKHERRQKRGGGFVRGESGFEAPHADQRGIEQVIGDNPTPEFGGLLGEEVRQLLNLLTNETLRAVAIARMQGDTVEEIATKLGVAIRTVQRKLSVIREIWSGTNE